MKLTLGLPRIKNAKDAEHLTLISYCPWLIVMWKSFLILRLHFTIFHMVNSVTCMNTGTSLEKAIKRVLNKL